MKALSACALAVALAGVGSARAAAAAPLQRFTLVIGANSGGSERARLQYAISDAERFARVMSELGGVTAANAILLKQPKLREVVDALDLLDSRVGAARRAAGAAGGRTEVIVYYSGHADEQGLLIGDDRYSYRTLRDRLDRIPADVRIAVLDACASGAFTRIKGGKSRPAFLVDESADMRGHAFLTSSAETESAQESDRIGASYFTHFLISGFRGAADLSGDGRVTLNEAYQFAHDETLRRTVDSRGGAQHPSYDINLSGTGDVVMTDMRQTTATLVLGEELDGRFFIRNAAQEMVVELYKPRGRQVELGIEPGAYDVRLELQKASLVAKTQIADGGRVILDAKQFGPAALEATRRRGDADPFRFAVAGRNRFELRFGMWNTGSATSATVSSGASDDNIFVGLQFTHYLRENLAMTFALTATEVQSGSSVGPEGIFSGSADALFMPVGVRWNPIHGDHRLESMKPYVAVSLGPVIGSTAGSFVGGGTIVSGSHDEATVGGHVGGGVDFHVARSFSIGVNGGYNWMADFSRPVGSRNNLSGPEFGLSLGWLFGHGRTATP
jgi:Caspase domain